MQNRSELACGQTTANVYLSLHTTVGIKPVKEFETINYQYMKHLNRITNLRNTLKPLLVLCGVMCRNFSKMFYWCGIYLFSAKKYEYGGFNHFIAGKIFKWKYCYMDISITYKIKFIRIHNSDDYYYDGYHNCLWIGCVRISYGT